MKITIIGCGTMGSGLAERLHPNHTLLFYDHQFEKSNLLQEKGYGTAYTQLNEAMFQSDVLILAVKPQSFEEAATLIGNKLPENLMVVSLLAGTLISKIKTHFPHNKVIRMMPNLALIYGEGVIGLAVNDSLTEKEKNKLTVISEPLGKIHWIDEQQMNAFTSLAGSGPAFVLALIESMVEVGIAMGFTARESQEIVEQMVKGSLYLLYKSGQSPRDLIARIAPPGGTTQAGLKKMDELGLNTTIHSVFNAASSRANEISKQ